MKKSKKIQTSHWERELSKEQIKYAANDAWFSRELFLKLEKDGIIPNFE
jgi:ribonuclease D